MKIPIPGLSTLHTMSVEQLTNLLKKLGYDNDDRGAPVDEVVYADRLQAWLLDKAIPSRIRIVVKEIVARTGQPTYRPLPRTPHPIVPLKESDFVLSAVRGMATILNSFSSAYSLTNGNVETLLKNVFGMAWIGTLTSRAYVMDKQFKRTDTNGRGPAIDLVAFDNREPQFWVETKCTFAECGEAAKRTATEALLQAWEYRTNLASQLEGHPGYILHFLSSVPQRTEFGLPLWVLQKFADLGTDRILPELLLEHYRIHANGQYATSAIERISVSPRPLVDAVIIQLKELPAI